MPRFSRMRIAALDELARELRFAPPEALERALERIESLVAELDAANSYPLEWAAYRVTGFRRESSGAPVTVPGRDLLSDLPALAERLSTAARFDASDLAGRGALDRAALSARWRVSRKTLERYKAQGLMGRRALGPLGRPRVVFMPEVVGWFERAHADLIARAAGFSRLGEELESRMVRQAARYQRRFGCGLNQTAKRLADHFGRSHEAVRQLLKRAERTHEGAPRYSTPGPLTRRQRAAALRAVARGIDPAAIAARWHRPRTAIARAVLIGRSDRLWSLIESGDLRPAAASGEAPGHGEQPSAAGVVGVGLGAPGQTDLLEFIRAARIRSVIVGVEELARATAMGTLESRSASTILSMSRSAPTAAAVDQAETSLRWAVLLKVELMRSQLPLLIDSVEGLVGAPLETLPMGLTSASLKGLLTACLQALAEAVEQFDVRKSGRLVPARLAAPATLGVTRAATRWIKAFTAGSSEPHAKPKLIPRAAGRLLAGVPIPDWTLRVSPWQGWLWPDARVRPALPELGPRDREILERRFAWGGRPPVTITELAGELGTTTARVSTMERRAIYAALREARASAGSQSSASATA